MRSQPGLVGHEVATRKWRRNLVWVVVGLKLDDLGFLASWIGGRDIIFEVATWVAMWEVATWILASRPENPTVGRNEVAT